MKPNILVFMTDQQRYDTIPPFSRAITPRLEEFCREGTVFTQAYCSSPHCCPSRTSFFSGLYPSEHGVWNNIDVGNALSRGPFDDIRLFSQDLKDNGYYLSYAGKWHVSVEKTPADYGFDRAKHQKRKVSVHPGMNDWEPYKKVNRIEGKSGLIQDAGFPVWEHYGCDEEPFQDLQVVNEAIEQIRTNPKEKPWFQFVGTLGPHDPYKVPQAFLDLYKNAEIRLPDNFHDQMADKPNFYKIIKRTFSGLSDEEHMEAIRHYLAFCSYEDMLFGKMIDVLKDEGVYDNTVVIYLSDHGDYCAEHGLWTKGLPPFDGAYHIPLAIRYPKYVYPNRTIDALVSIVDLAPSILDFAGVTSETSFAGTSILPLLKEEKGSIRDAIYTQSNGNELYGIQRTVKTKDYKFVYNGFDYSELYDLRNDPLELVNVINDSTYEPVVKDLSRKLWQFAYEVKDTAVNSYIMNHFAPFGPGVAFENLNEGEK